MDKAKAISILLRATHSVEEVLRKDISQYNMNPTEFGVLELLFHKGKQPIQNICNKLLMANSSMTYVIDKLEKKNLVDRENHSIDKRVTYIRLTDEGKNFIQEIYPKHEEVFNKIFAVLDDDELEVMSKSLKKIGYHASDLNK